MARNKPFPVSGLRPVTGTLTTNQGFLGMGRYLGGDIGPHGHRTPGLVGPATEPSASGTKYYVSKNGNDGNSGTSKSAPFKTFAPVSAGGSSPATSGDVVVVLDTGDINDVVLNDDSERFEPGAGDVTLTGENGTFPKIKVNYRLGQPPIRILQDNCVLRGFHLDGPVDTVGGTNDGEGTSGIVIDDRNTGASFPTTKADAKIAGWVYNVRTTHLADNAIFITGNTVGGVIERCHSAYNYGGPTDGGNADGIQISGATGETCEGGRIIGCLTNHNSNDNIDCSRSVGVRVIDCLSYAASYREDGSTTGIGTAGKGIRLGSPNNYDIGGSVAQRCVAVGNGGAGITAGGANLPVDVLYCTVWNNDRKASGENDIELYESSGGGASGFNLQDSRIVGCIAEQGLYISLQDGVIDSTNVRTCNFDDNNNFDPAFSQIPFASVAVDGDGYAANENTLGRLDTREDADSLPKIIDNGSTLYQTTPASNYHGQESVVSYSGDAPDLGAFETNTTTTSTTDSTTGENVKDYGAVGDGSTDDTQAIRDAADAAGPDGTVYFPAGTYLVGENTREPFLYPDNSSAWDSLTWRGESYDTATIKMAPQSADHFLFRGESGNPLVNPTFEQLTLDMNQSAQSAGDVSQIISARDGSGTITIRDCLLKNSNVGGVKDAGATMGLDIAFTEFRNIGRTDDSISGHIININPSGPTTSTVQNCLFDGCDASAIDAGQDTDNDYVTLTVSSCRFTNLPLMVKLDPENDTTTIENCYMDNPVEGSVGSGAIRSNNDSAQCGSLIVDNVELIGPMENAAIDLGSATNVNDPSVSPVELYQVRVKDADNGNNRAAGNGAGIHAEGSDMNTSGTISVYGVGANNDGQALNITDFGGVSPSGSIGEVRWGDAGSLGTLDGTATVNNSLQGGNEVSPNVPGTTEVGPRSP